MVAGVPPVVVSVLVLVLRAEAARGCARCFLVSATPRLCSVGMSYISQAAPKPSALTHIESAGLPPVTTSAPLGSTTALGRAESILAGAARRDHVRPLSTDVAKRKGV